MAMQTYTFVVSESTDGAGISADVVDEDGLVEATTRVAYEDYDLVVDRDGGTPTERSVEFTADVLSLRIQLQRLERNFEFRVVGDDEELARTTVADSEWDLVAAGD